MKVKTSELTGAALDWAVCIAEYGYGADYKTNRYSTNWSQGGPIIERERITLRVDTRGGRWVAFLDGSKVSDRMVGQTALITAMHCYVASKFGAEVEIPDELML